MNECEFLYIFKLNDTNKKQITLIVSTYSFYKDKILSTLEKEIDANASAHSYFFLLYVNVLGVDTSDVDLSCTLSKAIYILQEI